MGLFSRVRRLNGSPPPEPDANDAAAAAPAEAVAPDDAGDGLPPPSVPAPRTVAPGVAALRDGLQQLYTMRPSRDAYAEEAIKLIAKGAGVKAAALLVFEQRGGRTRLLASVGLDPETTQVLSGDSMVSGWDIPLRSLRNRRINVIEAAHENPFVPRQLVAISPRRLTIAALPFFHANAPVGVIVLFSPTPRGFADGLLKALSQALRVCALALSELPLSAAAAARVAVEEPANAQPSLLRGLAALKAELARLTAANDEAERQRASEAAERVTAQSFLKAAQDRAAQVEEELAAVREAQSRIPEIEEQTHQLSRRLAAASEAADSATQQVAKLQSLLAQQEQRAAQDGTAITELTAARKDLEQQIQAALDTARQRGEEVAALHAQVAELAPRAAQVSELQTSLAAIEAAKTETEAVAARLRQELLAAQDQRARAETALEQTSGALAANDTERGALAAQLTDARARIDALSRGEHVLSGAQERLRSLEAELAARQQELDASRAALAAGGSELAATSERAVAQVAELEAERAGAAAQVAELEGERERLTAGLDAARAEAERSAGELRRQGEALAKARHEIEAQRESLKDTNAERAQLVSRTVTLERELTAARAEHEAVADRLSKQTQAGERLLAERRELEARIQSLSAGGQSLEHERQAAVHAAQRRVGELEAEMARLSASLDATRTGAAEELNRTRHDAESTLDGLRVDLAEAARARDELQRALGAAQQECAAHQRALAEMSAERTRLETAAERLTGERSELSARIDTAGAERSALQRAHDEAVARVGAMETELRAVREQELAVAQAQLVAERDVRQIAEEAFSTAESRYQDEIAELRDRLAESTREQERLAHVMEEKDLLLQSAEEGLSEGLSAFDLADAADEDSVLDIDRACAPAGTETPADLEVFAEVEAAAAGEIILIDGENTGLSAARQLVEFGHRVSALAPTADPTDQFKERNIACAAINLAAPVAWSMLRHMRNGSGIPRVPLVAYALAAGAPKGFWLGPVDFAILPVADTDFAAILHRLVPKVRRVIAMSNDIDVMSDVRNQLTGCGISTAVVLDGRQALDLVPTIRPEAAVLHLSPSCVDVFRAIAGLRSADISRDIPILFLLDAEPQPREEAFLTAGVRMLTGRGSLVPDGLVDSLASAFDGYRAA